MNNILCSFSMYRVCYKILFLLAYPCFSCCFVNYNDCIVYMRRYSFRYGNILKNLDFYFKFCFVNENIFLYRILYNKYFKILFTLCKC